MDEHLDNDEGRNYDSDNGGGGALITVAARANKEWKVVGVCAVNNLPPTSHCCLEMGGLHCSLKDLVEGRLPI